MRYAFKSVDLYAPIDARIDLLGHRRTRDRGARRYAAHHHGFERSGLWCCTGWVEHLRRNGFIATVVETADL